MRKPPRRTGDDAICQHAGRSPVLGFCDALLAGLARDGGLYVPQRMAEFSRRRDPRPARPILSRYRLQRADALRRRRDRRGDLRADDREAYATFRHAPSARSCRPAPNRFILELFHGPTLAFKDVAMQLLARLMDHVLAERGAARDHRRRHLGRYRRRGHRRLCRARPHRHLHPVSAWPVSPVQQRQMTTSTATNVHALAIKGNFDDCQALVKDMFNDLGLPRPRGAVRRQLDQLGAHHGPDRLLLHVGACRSAGRTGRSPSPCRPAISAISSPATSPSAWACRSTGWSIATNDNDILARTLKTGRYEMRDVKATTSPSMDIQISSNFERLLFEALRSRRRHGARAHGRAEAVRRLRDRGTRAEGHPRASSAPAARQSEVAETIRATLAADRLPARPAYGDRRFTWPTSMTSPNAPMVTLATAHPAKFPAAVKAASWY